MEKRKKRSETQSGGEVSASPLPLAHARLFLSLELGPFLSLSLLRADRSALSTFSFSSPVSVVRAAVQTDPVAHENTIINTTTPVQSDAATRVGVRVVWGASTARRHNNVCVSGVGLGAETSKKLTDTAATPTTDGRVAPGRPGGPC